jgi:hypothetical protein
MALGTSALWREGEDLEAEVLVDEDHRVARAARKDGVDEGPRQVDMKALQWLSGRLRISLAHFAVLLASKAIVARRHLAKVRANEGRSTLEGPGAGVSQAMVPLHGDQVDVEGVDAQGAGLSGQRPTRAVRRRSQKTLDCAGSTTPTSRTRRTGSC